MMCIFIFHNKIKIFEFRYKMLYFILEINIKINENNNSRGNNYEFIKILLLIK